MNNRKIYRDSYRDGNEITILSMENYMSVGDFLYELNGALFRGYEDIIISTAGEIKAFPNACVPIASSLDFLKKTGLNIKNDSKSKMLENMRFLAPISATIDNIKDVGEPMSKIWTFKEPDEIFNLVNAFIETLHDKLECCSGVIESFEWCLNEVMDNVIQHSKAECGYAMVQVHPVSKHLAICISDSGQGVYNSLKESKYKPATDIDAITMAIKEGVTRDTKIGQGNGLWGLTEIIKVNNGQMSIASRSASLYLKEGELKKSDKLIWLHSKTSGTTLRAPGTTVDFQIDTSKSVNISEALKGHQPTNFLLEALENDIGDVDLKISEHAHGTGTRKSGEMMRNKVINLINQGAQKIILDFSGIAVVSSSFADEFIAKLVTKYGFIDFHQKFIIKGMNETTKSIVHRSFIQRMEESLNEKNI